MVSTPAATMMMLPALNSVLKQIVFPPDVLTAILLTPSGDLVSYVSHESRSKDDIRLLTGLSAEVWSETKEQDVGLVDSEMGRVLVMKISRDDTQDEPVLLISLNAAESARWSDVQVKAQHIVEQLAEPLKEVAHTLASAPALTGHQSLAKKNRAAH